MLVDADVEAPNLHLFLRPQLTAPESVFLPVPELNKEKCTACGACGEMCAYKAIAILGGKPVIFSDMCHGCGGCFAVCPSGALDEGRRELGSLQYGVWGVAQGWEIPCSWAEAVWVKPCRRPCCAHSKKRLMPGWALRRA